MSTRRRRFSPFLYRSVIIATKTAGTMLTDVVDRRLGISGAGGSSILFALRLATLRLQHRTIGSVSVLVHSIAAPQTRVFCWTTIIFSQTLGIALGDLLADTGGLGDEGGALLFGVAFQPLGAPVSDFLGNAMADGGLNLGRFAASAASVTFMIGLVLLLPQRAGQRPGGKARAP